MQLKQDEKKNTGKIVGEKLQKVLARAGSDRVVRWKRLLPPDV